MIKVSIEIPSSRLDYLDECINSVFEQTSKDWVINLVYNGKFEEYNYLRSKYASEKVNIYFIEEKKEIYELRQFLTENNNEEISFPLDSDDLLFPVAVKEIIESFQEYNNIGLVLGYSVLMKENTEIIKIEEEHRYPDYEFLKEIIYINNFQVHPLVKIQPYAFRKVIFDQHIKNWKAYPGSKFKAIGEEIDLLINFALAEDILLIAKPLYLYRDHTNNIFKKWGKEEISRATLNMFKELTLKYKQSKYNNIYKLDEVLNRDILRKVINRSIKYIKDEKGFKCSSISQEILPSI